MADIQKTKIQDTEEVPFNNVDSVFPANIETAEQALNYLRSQAQVTATPGYTWGASGSIKNSYLLNETVASNKSGRLVTLSGSITSIFIVTARITDEYTLEIRRRNANGTYTTILSLIADGTSRFYAASSAVSVAAGDELAAYIKRSGKKGATNPVTGILVTGNIV